MINEKDTLPPDTAAVTLSVLEGVEMPGQINVSDEIILANVHSAIRRGLPQIRPQEPKFDRVALVGSGPSLVDTFPALVEAVHDGAKLVTLNGAYHYCLERNLQPRTQIVMDARPSNARFVHPPVKDCRYLLASQCAPEVFDAVAGRDHVWLFHAASEDIKPMLDAYYHGQWYGVGGGVTVLTRAIPLLRVVGYVRFDLFGCDSCWMRKEHHAFPQPENEDDKWVKVTIAPSDHPERRRVFVCSPWHLKQFEDFLQMIRVNGDHFQLRVHGNGLLAYALEASADVEWSQETIDGSTGLQDLQPSQKEDRQYHPEPGSNHVSNGAVPVGIERGDAHPRSVRLGDLGGSERQRLRDAGPDTD